MSNNQFTSFDDIMDADVSSLSKGGSVAIKVSKDSYQELVARKNVLSYSMQELFHACPRKFQIKKHQAALQTEQGESTREPNVTFAFGHAVGAGVATFDETKSIDAAIWSAFLSWNVDLLAEEVKGTRRTGKSFHQAVWAIKLWEIFSREETDLDEYEVVKVEPTIAVDFEDGYFYIGHIDELLRNKITGAYRVKENKTTGMQNIHPATYSNSDQALSYSVVIDMLGAADYEVMYCVYSSSTQEWSKYLFIKTANAKASWLQDQLLLHQQLDAYAELDFFPMRGSNCMAYNRPCEFYETCQMKQQAVFGKRYDELESIEDLVALAALEPLDYATTMTDIANRQKGKLNE